MRHIVINLVRAPERLAAMDQRFKSLGLAYEVLPATDGQALTAAERALVNHARRRIITAYPLTDNEIGCWLSHRRAMQNLLDSGEAMASIIEDDAILSENFGITLAAIEHHAPAFDVIDLHRNFKKTEIFAPSHTLPGPVVLGRIGPMNMNLTAYVISRQGAQTFIANTQRIIHAVDKELHSYWKNGLDIYGLQNPIAQQDPTAPSYIDETRLQNAPGARARYPAANWPHWYLMRFSYKHFDSFRKRRAFARLIADQA